MPTPNTKRAARLSDRRVVNPTVALASAQFALRTRGENGLREITFHPGLEGDWRQILQVMLIVAEARPGTSAADLRRAGIAGDVLELLGRLGVLVDRDQVPAEVSFACELSEVEPLPAANARLELNPMVHVQTSDELPQPLAARLPAGREALASSFPTLWIDDPGTEIPMPFTAGGKTAEMALDLVAGKLAVERLAPRWRSVFEQATILVPRGHMERRRRQWQRICAQAARALQTKEHAVLRALLNPLQLQALRRYMRRLRQEGYLSGDGVQVKERVVRHNEPMARLYHAPLSKLINRFTPEPTKPSYCFAAHYQAGAELKRHTDRPQCVWNVSFAVDSTPDPMDAAAWPLFIESRGRVHEVQLGLGDAVLYSGTKSPHWRDAQPAGQVSTMVFYHFVPTNFEGSLD